MTPTALYRHFDEDGELLYVGISLSAIDRLAQHRRGAPWYIYITRIEVQWYWTREDALAAEARAIHDEGPVFNKAHANQEARRERLIRARDRADAAERCLLESRAADAAERAVNGR